MTPVPDAPLKAAISGAVCAGVAAFLNPLDVVKIRMQNNSPITPWPEKSFLRGIRRLFEVEGFAGLTRGLPASIIRELSYSTIRMGAYEPILHILHGSDTAVDTVSPALRYLSALLAGATGAALANPTDLIKVSFQSHAPATLPYSTTFSAFRYFAAHRLLYKGVTVTTTRAALLNASQLGSYDTIKKHILIPHVGLQDGFLCHFIASMLAGIITTTVANPGTTTVAILTLLYYSTTSK